jgi:hypothetical protein
MKKEEKKPNLALGNNFLETNKRLEIKFTFTIPASSSYARNANSLQEFEGNLCLHNVNICILIKYLNVKVKLSL